jgi:hypothetical protein
VNVQTLSVNGPTRIPAVRIANVFTLWEIVMRRGDIEKARNTDAASNVEKRSVTIVKSMRSRNVISAPKDVFLPSIALSREVKESDFCPPACAEGHR